MIDDTTNPTPTPAPPPPSPKVGDTRPAPRIGDTRPGAPSSPPAAVGPPGSVRWRSSTPRRPRTRLGPGQPPGARPRSFDAPVEASAPDGAAEGARTRGRKRRGGERRTRAQGRYLMCVHTTGDATHIATLEGRSMVEYIVAKAADETNQIDGNIYVGRIQNVLPGMELAFVDIGIPKNAVLYRGDVTFDQDDLEGRSPERQAHRADDPSRPDHRLSGHQERHRRQGRAPHPGGLDARALRGAGAELGDRRHLQAPARRRAPPPAQDHRRRQARAPRHHHPHRRRGRHRRGPRARRDVAWPRSGPPSRPRSPSPTSRASIYRDLDLAVRVLREELNDDYRGVIIDDRDLYEKVREYVAGGQPRAGRPHRVLRPRRPRSCRSSSATSSTSSCTGPSTARSSCPRAAR